jgi:hypothetical protein
MKFNPTTVVQQRKGIETFYFKLVRTSDNSVKLQSWHSQLTSYARNILVHTKCRLLSTSWGWANNAETCRSKAIPLQALTGPEGCRRLRLPDFKTIGTGRCVCVCYNFIRILWAPWRWRSYSAETCRSNIDILNIRFTLLWICISLVLFRRNLKMHGPTCKIPYFSLLARVYNYHFFRISPISCVLHDPPISCFLLFTLTVFCENDGQIMNLVIVHLLMIWRWPITWNRARSCICLLSDVLINCRP